MLAEFASVPALFAQAAAFDLLRPVLLAIGVGGEGLRRYVERRHQPPAPSHSFQTCAPCRSTPTPLSLPRHLYRATTTTNSPLVTYSSPSIRQYFQELSHRITRLLLAGSRGTPPRYGNSSVLQLDFDEDCLLGCGADDVVSSTR
jgi:hypothetical protein